MPPEYANDNIKTPRFSRWTRRGMSKEEAAEYCGCATTAAFDSWIQKGIVPGPIPGTNRWDRKAIDVWLDRASEIEPMNRPTSDPLEDWLASRAGRKGR